ncbi:hypothetical protein D3C73_1570870 [compost metagenome]
MGPQHPDFIIVAGLDPYIQIAVLNLLHQADHGFQRARQCVREQGCNEQGEGQNEKIRHKLLHAVLLNSRQNAR